ANREYQRPAFRQLPQNFLDYRLIAVGPVGIEVRMHEVAVALLGYFRRTAQEVGTAPGDFHQLDAERLKLFILGPRDGLRNDPDHAKAVRPRPDRSAKGRIPHRRDDELPLLRLPTQQVEQMHRPTNLEAAAQAEVLAFGVDLL